MRQLGFAVIFLLVLGICFAEIPHTINYQGKITNSAGVGLDGTYSMTFRFFNAPTGGSELWSETIPSVSIHKGLFDVVLGELNPIELPFDTVYWLQIEVEGEILSPRIKLSSVGYAYRSEIADSVVKGVSSLNSLTGNIRLVGEGGITIDTSGSEIIVNLTLESGDCPNTVDLTGGSATNQYVPVNLQTFSQSIGQFLVLGSEMSCTGGRIYRMTLYTNLTSGTISDIDVWLDNVYVDNLSAGSIPPSGEPDAANVTLTINSDGSVVIDLPHGFLYTGHNILVTIRKNSTSGIGALWLGYNTSPRVNARYNASSADFPLPSTANFRPNVKFDFTPPELPDIVTNVNGITDSVVIAGGTDINVNTDAINHLITINYTGAGGIWNQDTTCQPADFWINGTGKFAPCPVSVDTIFYEGFEGDWLPAGWSIDSTNHADSTWHQGTIAHSGSYAAEVWWSYSHQDERLITPDIAIPSSGTYYLSFYAYVYLGSTYGDHYYVEISTDGGSSWDIVADFSDSVGDMYDAYSTRWSIDLSTYAGSNIRIAWRCEDPPSNDGCWYVYAIDDVVISDSPGYSEVLISDGSISVTDNLTVGNNLTVGKGITIGGEYRTTWPATGFQRIRADGSPWLTDSLTLVSGTNITLTQTGDSITIAAVGGAGDNWGSQVVQHDATLAGDGTSANPLKIAQQGASVGQVLKWNGSTWAPADDIGGGSGDNLGNHTATMDLNMSDYDIDNVDNLYVMDIYGNGVSQIDFYDDIDMNGNQICLGGECRSTWPSGGSDNDWGYLSGSGLSGTIYHTGNAAIGRSSWAGYGDLEVGDSYSNFAILTHGYVEIEANGVSSLPAALYAYCHNSYYGVFGRSSGGIGVYGYGASGSYDFYAGGPGTNYGGFTGGHDVKILPEQVKIIKEGMIVSFTGENKFRIENGDTSISSTLPTVKLSDTMNDPAVFGVFTGRMNHDIVKLQWYFDESDSGCYGIVNALGEGRVWVTNINGEIQKGDLITTSPIPGYGQKQDDDLIHSYTVGKAIETVDWDKVKTYIEFKGKKYKAYLIAVVYMCG